MTLLTVAKTHSLRAPTASRKQTAVTLGNKRLARVQASAAPAEPEGRTSRRDMAKAVFLAAPLVAGLVPSSALAFGESNLTSFQVRAPDSSGIGEDDKFAIAIFKYEVPNGQDDAFVKAFADAKKQAFAMQPKVQGLSDFTFFQETGTNVYFSVAIFRTEQAGRDFIGTDFGQKFIKQIVDLGVKFLPNGAVFKG